MTRFPFAAMLALALWAMVCPNLSAQVFYGENNPYCPPVVQAAPSTQATQRFPRLYKFLELASEPGILTSPMPYPGYQPTPHPLLDSAPQFANIAFLALYGLNNPVVNWIGSGIPPLLRTVRVILYGPPAGINAMRGNTLLWIASPFAAKARLNWAATGHIFNPPFLHRPLFPRLHARRHGYHCECP
jgi:hypothetical protein